MAIFNPSHYRVDDVYTITPHKIDEADANTTYMCYLAVSATLAEAAAMDGPLSATYYYPGSGMGTAIAQNPLSGANFGAGYGTPKTVLSGFNRRQRIVRIKKVGNITSYDVATDVMWTGRASGTYTPIIGQNLVPTNRPAGFHFPQN